MKTITSLGSFAKALVLLSALSSFIAVSGLPTEPSLQVTRETSLNIPSENDPSAFGDSHGLAERVSAREVAVQPRQFHADVYNPDLDTDPESSGKNFFLVYDPEQRYNQTLMQQAVKVAKRLSADMVNEQRDRANKKGETEPTSQAKTTENNAILRDVDLWSDTVFIYGLIGVDFMEGLDRSLSNTRIPKKYGRKKDKPLETIQAQMVWTGLMVIIIGVSGWEVAFAIDAGVAYIWRWRSSLSYRKLSKETIERAFYVFFSFDVHPAWKHVSKGCKSAGNNLGI